MIGAHRFAPTPGTADTPGSSSPSTARLQRWREALLQLETDGWKGRRGSAIAQSEALERFVDTLIEHAAGQARLLLAIAYAGERPVAAQFGLINDGEILLYKSGYDEASSQFSPGRLLLLDVAAQALRHGLRIDSCADPAVALYRGCLDQQRTTVKRHLGSRHRRVRWLLHGLAALRAGKRAGKRAARTAAQTATKTATRRRAGPR